MIHTSKQLKDKVRNISHGDNEIAQVMIRNFIMERFLERVSLSKYKKNIILKGGMLVASLVGIETRATMDIDTTVKALPLNKEDTVKIINDIINISVEDGINFGIAKVTGIMTEFEYPGVRVALEATLDRLKQRIKIDISTDDVIIPSAISYNYRLMFEDRSIELMTYTTETLLAEKIQTILARGITTTRMRDFYDVYELVNGDKVNVERRLLLVAFSATCAKRKTVFDSSQMERTLQEIRVDKGLEKLWELYQKDNFYVGDMKWALVCETVCTYISEELAKRT